MATIEVKKNKKVVRVKESEVLHQTHLNHVILALEAFSESKTVVRIKSTELTAETFGYNFTFSKSIPVSVLKKALKKLQISFK